MVEIAHHQALDRGPMWNDVRKNTGFLHLPQSHRHLGLREEFLPGRPGMGCSRNFRRAYEPPLRVPGKWHAMSRGKSEHTQYRFGGSQDERRIAQQNAIVRNRELGAREPLAPIAELPP